MIAMILSIICFGMSIYQIINGGDIGGIIFMSSSIIWYILYLVALNISNESTIKRALIGSRIKKEEKSHEFS